MKLKNQIQHGRLGTARPTNQSPGSTAAWNCKPIYRLNDEQVGQWSDVACVGVLG